MSSRAQLILIIAFVVGALCFVGYEVFRASGIRTYASDATFTERARLAEIIPNGVRVAVFVESDSQGQPLLSAKFTPTDRGFHLYSKDLDPKMTGGFGVATRFELLPNSSVRTAGSPFSDLMPQSHSVGEFTVDIYPDGPVTLRLPIQFVGAATTIKAQVALSYMACKTDGVCLPPVERHILNVRIERSALPPNPAAAADAPIASVSYALSQRRRAAGQRC